MPLPSIYNRAVISDIKQRIDKLNANNQPLWGVMNPAQMLAHLNVMFEIGFVENQKRPNAFLRFVLQKLVKPKLIDETPYKKNSRTAPEMVISHQPDFGKEKERLDNYLDKVSMQGAQFFEQRKHPVFGNLSSQEWSNLFYKHIDHHLKQYAL
ncbi:MAG: DUF1569 domain-containing protein [Fulvivirga sp.]|uniref:DUF1569 domain-containing protein n=1 Tax=Fulvivirga sp. TaxID=1931237 RepID=UPI0032ED220F